MVGWSESALGNPRDGKAHYGGLVTVGQKGGMLRIECAVLPLVTTSMAEAEVCAASQLVKQIEFLRNLMKEIGYEQNAPTTVFMDCEPGMDAITNGHGASQRTRHIGLRVMYVSEQHALGRVVLSHVPTEAMPCDIFTKWLPFETFATHRNALRNVGGKE
jgi:hypothetical protein